MEKVLRSLLLEKFSEELRVKIELLSRRRDIHNKEKHEELIKLMLDSGIENIVKLGPGTNRYAFKLDGFVVKVATDHDGKIDNLKEFKMAKRLYPYVAKTYEVSENGTLLVAEYIQPFGSYLEMSRYAEQIRAILRELSSVYLIGDVGITSKNYANWGLRTGTNDPVCLDFAYVYEVSSSLFLCRQCKANAMLMPNDNFTELICPVCKKTATFEDIRGRIGNDVHRHEIGDLSEEGYRLTASNTLTELTESRSSYLVKKSQKQIKKEEPEMSKDKSFAESMAGMPFASPSFPLRVMITKADTPAVEADAKPHTRQGIQAPEGISVKIDKKEGADSQPKPTCAFSCAVDEEDGMGIPDPEPEEEATEPLASAAEPEPESAPVPDEPKPEPKTEPVLSYYQAFREENATRALSGISNMIGQYAQETGLFGSLDEGSFADKNIRSDTFYKGVQNAIHRSLAWLCGFEIDEVPRNGGVGTMKRFTAPDTLSGETQIEAFNFLYRYWINKELNTCDGSEYMSTYCKMFRDLRGFPMEWRGFLRKRLKEKMPLTDDGVEEIVDKICSVWCEDDPEPDPIDDDELVPGAAFSTNVDDGDDEEDDDDGYEPSIRIDVVHDDEYDVLRLSYADYFGGCCIPFYAKLSEISIENQTIPSIVDDRNGDWDWLIHLVPDWMFYTKDPQKYLAHNDLNLTGDIFRIVIMDYNPKTKMYVMGLYFLEGVFNCDDEDEETPITDPDTLRRIFRMLREDISYVRISHLRRSLEHEDLIHPENEIELVDGRIHLMGDDEDEEEENMEVPEKQRDPEFDSREAAAAAALLGEDREPEEEIVPQAPAEEEKTPEPEKEDDEEDLTPQPERIPEPIPEPEPTRPSGGIPVAHRKRDRKYNRDHEYDIDRDR